MDYIQGTIECWKIELSLLMSHNHPQRVLAILAQPMFHVEGILAMGILHQALQIILLAMRQTARMQEFRIVTFHKSSFRFNRKVETTQASPGRKLNPMIP